MLLNIHKKTQIEASVERAMTRPKVPIKDPEFKRCITRKAVATKRAKALWGDEERIYEALCELEYYETDAAYKKGIVGLVSSFKGTEEPVAIEWLKKLWVASKCQKTKFKRAFIKMFTPGHVDSEIQEKIEGFWSWPARQGGRLCKTKFSTVGTEWRAIHNVSKARKDCYMFNHQCTNPLDTTTRMYKNICFDFDVPTNLAHLIPLLPFNVIVVDKAPLAKIEWHGGVYKERIKGAPINDLSQPLKVHAYIFLELDPEGPSTTKPVWNNNSKSTKYYKDIRALMLKYLQDKGFKPDLVASGIVMKNVFNTNLYQSFLLSEHRHTLSDLQTLLALRGYKLQPKEQRRTSPKNTGTLQAGLDVDSRNATIYDKLMRSSLTTYDQLLSKALTINNAFDEPLGINEVRKTVSSVMNNEYWLRHNSTTTYYNYAQILGNYKRMQDKLEAMLIIREHVEDPQAYQLSSDQLAEQLRIVIYEHTYRRYSVSTIRKLIYTYKDWFATYKWTKKQIKKVSFEEVNKWMHALQKGKTQGLTHIVASYILYKISFDARFYKGFNLPVIKETLTKFMNRPFIDAWDKSLAMNLLVQVYTKLTPIPNVLQPCYKCSMAPTCDLTANNPCPQMLNWALSTNNTILLKAYDLTPVMRDTVHTAVTLIPQRTQKVRQQLKEVVT